MKKTICAVLAVLFVLSLAGCGGSLKKSENGAPAIAIMPHYQGDGEDDPFYEFTTEDLTVLITYTDGATAEMTEGFVVTTTTSEGYFFVEVEWNGLTGDTFFPIGKEKYQAYKAAQDERKAEVQAEVDSMKAEEEALVDSVFENAPETEPAA